MKTPDFAFINHNIVWAVTLCNECESSNISQRGACSTNTKHFQLNKSLFSFWTEYWWCGENEECNFLTAGKSNLGSLWKCAHSQFGMLALRPDSILSSFIFCHSFFYLFIHPFIHYLSAVLNKSVGNDENDDDNDDDDDDDDIYIMMKCVSVCL